MIKIIPNFLSEDNRIILKDWALQHYESNFFVSPNMNPKNLKTRKTTRGSNNNFIYPEAAYDVQKQIIKYFKLSNYLFPDTFKDGIVCGVGSEYDAVHSHKDPIYYKDTYTMHANFIVQKPESGGITIINGIEYDINENDLLLFIPSHTEHEVSEALGSIKRVLWCYSFCINKENIDRIFI